MNENVGQKQSTGSRFGLHHIERLHPHKMLLYLSMLGSALIFGFLLLAYSISRPEDAFQALPFPKTFVVSTIVLLVSSFTAGKIMNNFHEERIGRMRIYLLLTIGLGLVFSLVQFQGWLELEHMGIYMSGKASGAYLYVISGMHVLHLIAALSFMTYLFLLSVRVKNDPVDKLLLITNPYRKIQFEMFINYWHFLDAIWLVIFVVFLAQY